MQIELLTQNERDFEGGIGGWAAYGAAASIAQSAVQWHGGAKSLAITTTAINNGAVLTKSYDAGAASLTYSYYIFGPSGHVVTCYLVVGNEVIYRNVTLNGTWQFFTITFDDAPAGGAITLYFWDTTAAGTIYLDDLSLQETIGVAPGGMAGVQTVTVVGGDYWLLHPTTSSFNCRLAIVKTDDFSEQYEETEMNILGRGRKKDYGTRWGFKGQLVAEIWDRSDLTARQQRLNLMALKAQKRDVYLRNPFGDLWLVTMGEAGISRVAGVGQLEFVVVTLPYAEVS